MQHRVPKSKGSIFVGPEFDDKVVFESEIPGPSAPRASRYDPFGTLSLITDFISSLKAGICRPYSHQ
ncbi:Uncharacterised protein [Serratia quinivorans]|nr:Uncharacterised protein [Serratia quinivorans]CAI1101048.1 Uncharacterised protein [Serratia quinivorans]CAI1173534.1 Uncharacterised protein [Serratia quinivorans]CAI1808255.1 Uncharacterised protein [Serratia quinivorans]CAI2145114.1 Uncharacterised protein [Serratia quinivorans]